MPQTLANFAMAAVITLLLLPTLSLAGFCDEPGWGLIFQDEFSGTSVNESSWSIRVNSTPNDSSCRDAVCTPDNVVVQDGVLALIAKRENYRWSNYTTGAIESKGKRFWAAAEGKPFRMCVNGKTPGGHGTGAGLWPAFWAMPNDDSCWPTHGEIDVLEEIDGDGTAHATYHFSPSKCGADNSSGGSLYIGESMHTQFHEYSVERTTNSLAFVYDGVTVFNSTDKNKLPVLAEVPWYLILNFAVGGPWPKPVNSSTVFPATTYVDYVRVSSPLG